MVKNIQDKKYGDVKIDQSKLIDQSLV